MGASSGIDGGVARSHWLSGAGTGGSVLPDGITDATEAIAHNGQTTVGGNPAAVIALTESVGGRNNAFAAANTFADHAYVYQPGNEFRHFLSHEHDAGGDLVGNRISWWLNTGTTAGASSAPNVGNQNTMTITANGLVVTNGAIRARNIAALGVTHVEGGASVGLTDGISAAVSTSANILNVASPTVVAAAVVTPSETAIRAYRVGTAGIKFNMSLETRIGTWGTGLAAQTQVDWVLGNGNVHVGDATVLTLQSRGRVGVNTAAPAAAHDVSGAVVHRVGQVFATFGVPPNFTTALVDASSVYLNTQTIAGLAGVIGPPTDTTAGRHLTLINIGTVSYSVNGFAVVPGRATHFMWSGTAWVPSAGTGAASAPVGFTATVNLVNGVNAIVDNLALAAPFGRIVQVLDATGGTIAGKVTLKAANGFSFTTAAAFANAVVTVVGF